MSKKLYLQPFRGDQPTEELTLHRVSDIGSLHDTLDDDSRLAIQTCSDAFILYFATECLAPTGLAKVPKLLVHNVRGNDGIDNDRSKERKFPLVGVDGAAEISVTIAHENLP